MGGWAGRSGHVAGNMKNWKTLQTSWPLPPHTGTQSPAHVINRFSAYFILQPVENNTCINGVESQLQLMFWELALYHLEQNCHWFSTVFNIHISFCCHAPVCTWTPVSCIKTFITFSVFLFVEQVLQSFSQQSGVWHHCMFFMNHSTNHYVLMFCASVFEVCESSSVYVHSDDSVCDKVSISVFTAHNISLLLQYKTNSD